MDESKLLPCPFCGGRAFYTTDANAPNYVYVRCSCCQARSEYEFAGDIIDGREDTNRSQLAHERAAESWNRRENVAGKIREILAWAYQTQIELCGQDGGDKNGTDQE